MTSKKRILLWVSAVFVACWLLCLPQTSDAKDPGADFLKRMVDVTGVIKDITCDFSLTSLSRDGKSRKLAMEVTYKKPGKFLITYLLPSEEAGSKVILTKEGAVFLPKGHEKVEVFDSLRVAWLDILILGLLPIYEEGYTRWEYLGEEKLESGPVYLFKVNSRLQNDLTVQRVWLDKSSYAVVRAEVEGFWGSRILLRAVGFDRGQGTGKGSSTYTLKVTDIKGNDLGEVTMKKLREGFWFPSGAFLDTQEGGLVTQSVENLRINTGVKDASFVVKEADQARADRKEGNKALERKDYERARQAFERAEGFFPNDIALKNNLGLAYMNLGMYDKAIEKFEGVLRLDPQNAPAYNNLGFVYADSGKDPRLGIRLIERAIEFDPANPSYLESLAWAFYKAGMLDEALRGFKRVLLFESEMDADLRSTAHYHLALVYRDRGETEEAISELRKALAADRRNEAAREELSRLATQR